MHTSVHPTVMIYLQEIKITMQASTRIALSDVVIQNKKQFKEKSVYTTWMATQLSCSP